MLHLKRSFGMEIKKRTITLKDNQYKFKPHAGLDDKVSIITIVTITIVYGLVALWAFVL